MPSAQRYVPKRQLKTTLMVSYICWGYGMRLAAVYQTFFLIVVPCIILSAISYIAIIGWQDINTELVEPQIIGKFPLRQDWRVQLDTPVYLPLATWKDMVFIRTSKSLYAVSSKDGTIIWQRDDLGKSQPEIIFAQDGFVIVSQDKPTILVLDAQTGQTVVSIPDPTEYAGIESAAFDEQSVYLIQDSYLSVYDLASGDARWGNFIDTGVDVFINLQADKFFLVGSQEVKTFDRKTGKLLQSVKLFGYLEHYPYPNIYDVSNNELLLIREENLYTFDPLTQSIRLRLKIGKLKFYPRLIRKTLYITNATGVVIAIDVASSEILWRQEIPDAELLQTPNLLGEYLYTKDQFTGRIYAISLSTQELVGYLQIGQRRLKTNFPEGINPVVTDERLIVTQGDRVYGYAP